MNGFCVSPTILPLAGGLRKRSSFPAVLMSSMLIIGIIFSTVGSCYLGFGSTFVFRTDKGEELTLLAIISKIPSLHKYSVTANIATMIICVSHFLCLFAPIGELADSMVLKYICTPEATESLQQIKKAVVRIAILGICLMLALVLPGFPFLLGVVATTVVPFLQVIFPVGFYYLILKKLNRSISLQMQLALGSAALVGVVFSVIGIYCLTL
jgi:uncharacterized membrane protein YedE/YeeE